MANPTPTAPDDGPALFGSGELTYTISDKEFEGIRHLVMKRAGINLTPVKKNLVISRLSRRLRNLGIPDFSAYLRYLEGLAPNDNEFEELINRISTNKTDFFREPVHFEFLKSTVLPGRRSLDIWSAACSSGEEPYSLALTLLDWKEPLTFSLTASDISTKVLGEAEAGIYDIEKISPVPLEQKRRYFLKGVGSQEGLVSVKPEVRARIHFRQINLMDHTWPHSRPFDVIFLRNVLIYFDKPTKTALLERIAKVIRPGGYLIVGLSDSLIGLSERFDALGHSIHRYKGAAP